MVSILPLSILAKSLKKVVEISKYFKKNLSTNNKTSYAQVSSYNTNMARETLEIKEAFLNL